MSLDSLAVRLVQPALLRALERWERGRLTLHLPDGRSLSFGPPGAAPHATLFIERDAFFRKLALRGDMGAGESYVDGDWRADDLARFLSLALANRSQLPLDTGLSKLANLTRDLFHLSRANTLSGSRRNIADHYDLSNELFALFLDETLTYSSAVFADTGEPLADAQRRKYRQLADKARIGPRDHVLEIGCGWGGFAIFAARSYGCRVTGITISERQHALARRRVREAGLDGRVEIRLQDYRELSGRYDKVVSIEMFEALGQENWPRYFRKIEEVLDPRGLAVLQTIAIPDHRFEEYRSHCDWLQRYIFPGSLLASLQHLTAALAGASTLGVHALEDVGIHYAETLRRWRAAFFANLDGVRRLGFDDRFVRTWDYYLSVCEAAFATRTLSNLQLVLTRPGNLSLPGIPEAALAQAGAA